MSSKRRACCSVRGKIKRAGDRLRWTVYSDDWPGIDLSCILDRSRWGNGFATEAARAALEWAWSNSHVDHIISLIAPENLSSIRVALKIGERFERIGANPINSEPIHIYGIHRPGQPGARI